MIAVEEDKWCPICQTLGYNVDHKVNIEGRCVLFKRICRCKNGKIFFKSVEQGKKCFG
jgi:hypothetical protein